MDKICHRYIIAGILLLFLFTLIMCNSSCNEEHTKVTKPFNTAHGTSQNLAPLLILAGPLFKFIGCLHYVLLRNKRTKWLTRWLRRLVHMLAGPLVDIHLQVLYIFYFIMTLQV